MMDDRTQKYANTLAELIRMETISFDVQPDKTPFPMLMAVLHSGNGHFRQS